MKHVCNFAKKDSVIPESVKTWLVAHFNMLGNGIYRLTIEKPSAGRTNSQNALMWMWFACIERETGQDKQDVHDYYCSKFLRRMVVNPATGECVQVVGGTSKLDTAAFSEFMDKVQADAAVELGITLPVPEDECFAEFEREYRF